MKKKIQDFLWGSAKYNLLVVRYCKTKHSLISSVGLLFIVQIIFLFFSCFLLAINWINPGITISIIISGLLCVGYYMGRKKMIEAIHEKPNEKLITLYSFVNLLIALVLSYPFWMAIFGYEINYRLYLSYGIIPETIIDKIYYQTIGLISLFRSQTGVYINFMCASIFIFIYFVLHTPYLLIYQSYKSIYNSIKYIYEKRTS